MFDTETDYDFVDVYDGPTVRSPQLGQPLSGSMATLAQTSMSGTGSSLVVEFTSDDSVGGQGFDAQWTCGTPGGGSATSNAGSLTPGARPTTGNVAVANQPVAYSLAAQGGVTYDIDVQLEGLSDSVLQVVDRAG